MTATAASPSLDGSWQMVRAEFDGETAPDLVAQKTILEITGQTYRISFDGSVADEGTFEINHNAPLPRLTLHGSSGTNGGRTIEAIFQHVGHRLRICFGLDGVTPVAFSTQPGANRYLATYRLVG